MLVRHSTVQVPGAKRGSRGFGGKGYVGGGKEGIGNWGWDGVVDTRGVERG